MLGGVAQRSAAARLFAMLDEVAVAMVLVPLSRLPQGAEHLPPSGRQSIQAEKPRDGTRGVNRCLFDEAALYYHALGDRIGVCQIRQ